MSDVTINSNQIHRGDRLNPVRWNRIYHHLMQLRKSYERLAEEFRDDLRDAKLIDYGCGSMPYRTIFDPIVAEYIGCDLPGNGLAECDILEEGRMNVEDHSFDVVLSSQVLEHVENPKLYLDECLRVIKTSGLLLLSTHGVWRYHPDPTDYWRWTSQGLRRQFELSNFDIVDFEGIMAPAATGIQLFQDAVHAMLPPPLRQFFCLTCQWSMWACDRLQKKAIRDREASVYIVAARPTS